MSYARFAKTYDMLMDKTLYPKWAAYVAKYVKQSATILELACGTGELASLLAENYTVLASDLSADMLALAQQKVPNHVHLLQLDMRAFDIETAADAITCFADSLCYLDNEDDVLAAFQQAYAHLTTNGVYLFDVHTPYQIALFADDYQYHYCDEQTVFVWQSFAGEEPDSIEHELTCCQEQADGRYERYDELHYQRTYPLATYQQLLKQAGFKKIDVFADFGNQAIQADTTRWFFACFK